MNNFTAIVNLCRDVETLELGGRECRKLRLADSTFGKNTETRFLDAIVSGPDVGTADRLKSGDQIVVTGMLTKTSYKSKAGKNKGKTVEADSIPFAKILQVTKSPTFFASTDGEGELDSTAPDLTEGADDESPLAGIL